MDRKTILDTARGLLETQKKRLVLFSVVGVIVVGGLALNFMYVQSKKEVPLTLDEVSKKAPSYDVARDVTDKNYWMHQAEGQLKRSLKETAAAKAKTEELEEEKLKKMEKEPKNQAYSFKELEALLKRIETLEGNLEQAKKSNGSNSVLNSQQFARPNSGISPRNHLPNNVQENNSAENQQSSVAVNTTEREQEDKSESGSKVTLNTDHFHMNASHQNYLDIKDWILAGTFVRGIMLNGMDVSTGEGARVNPTPVAVQLVEPGNLPNFHEGQFKHCVVLGAAHGDKASERAKFRLEKLTCVWNIDGEDKGVSTDVVGYVVGLDGKEGVRGKMIRRDKEALTKAFWAKFVGSMGTLLSQGQGQQSISPQGNMLKTMNSKDLVTGGALSGVGGAFDLLSQMAIKEIDKLSDIIQIPGGQALDLVFAGDVELTQKRALDKVKNTGNEAVTKVKDIFK